MCKSKILSFSLLLLILLMLYACADNSENTETENYASAEMSVTESEKESDVQKRILRLINGDGAVRIIYGTKASEAEIATANNLRDKILGKLDCEVVVAAEGEYDANTAEIVVGGTDYPESKELQVLLKCYGQSVARVVGNKLVVAASDDQFVNDSYEKIISRLMSSFDFKDSQGFGIDGELEIMLALDNLFSYFPIVSGYTLEPLDTGDGCYMLNIEEQKEETFDKIIDTLTKNGFALYASNKIDENEYSTYVSDNLVVNAIHTSKNEKYKLLVESLDTTGLPKRAEDNQYTPISGMSPTITQVGCYYGGEIDANGGMTMINGMCYVVRLSDGSFIVVDGGYGQLHADNVYKVLKKQASNPNNIVISAWVISHDHGDHVGFFPCFARQYGDKVTVKQFIYNFPSNEQCALQGNNSENVKKNIKLYFADSTVIKAHPGQVFHISDAKIKILYTLDINDSKITDTNNASIVWQLEFSDNTKFMCFADYAENSKTLLDLYTSETLKSDIVQVAHHGTGGQDGSIYALVKPEYAFFPVAAWNVKYYSGGKYHERYIKSINKWFFNDTNIDKNNLFLAADDIIVMTIQNNNISVAVYDNIEVY